MIVKHGRHIFGEIQKFVFLFFLDCAFQVLIGWVDSDHMAMKIFLVRVMSV